MKISQVIKQFEIKDADGFELFATMQRKIPVKDGSFSITVSDEDAPALVEAYKADLAEKAAKEAKKKQKEQWEKEHQEEAKAERERLEAERIAREQEEAERKRKALSEMLISSGFSFEGYRITKYSGYISGDDATQIPRTGYLSRSNTGVFLTDALVQIRIQAIKELKEAAYALGCNAIIGVDFDYITLEPQTANLTGGTTYEPYVICVTANGNAVVIEKDE